MTNEAVMNDAALRTRILEALTQKNDSTAVKDLVIVAHGFVMKHRLLDAGLLKCGLCGFVRRSDRRKRRGGLRQVRGAGPRLLKGATSTMWMRRRKFLLLVEQASRQPDGSSVEPGLTSLLEAERFLWNGAGSRQWEQRAYRLCVDKTGSRCEVLSTRDYRLASGEAPRVGGEKDITVATIGRNCDEERNLDILRRLRLADTGLKREQQDGAEG